ncbi:hypothetical protein Gorai_008660, partial [Gossypium raimondii]|nr:hypothetical protein [Gossypium raimondii]
VSFCEKCGDLVESSIHATRDCGFPKAVWKLVVPRWCWGHFFYLSRNKWYRNAFIFSGASGSNSKLISSALAWTKSLGVKGIEARVILKGLKLAWAKGFKCVELESDSAMLIEIIHNGLATISSVAEAIQIHD